MARYWFVRHGESTANAEGWLAGHRDVPLTEKGLQQAMALKPALAGLTPDRVLASDLQRAWRTAAIAWDHRLPPFRRAPGLRERHLGAWEGARLHDLAQSGGMEVLLSWGRSPPGGESHQTLSLRVLRFLHEQDDGGDTLIFAHGGLIRAIVGLLDDVPLEAIGRFKVANTEVLARDVAPGTWAALYHRLSDP